MNLIRIEKIINKVEGAGTFVLDTPLALHNIATIVNSFDWSGSFVRYDKVRVLFKANGLYYLIPVMKVDERPAGVGGVDYDEVNGNFWLFMKPRGTLACDILSVSGIGAIKLYPKVTGGII